MFNLILKLLSIFLSGNNKVNLEQAKEAPASPKPPEPNSPPLEPQNLPKAPLEPLKPETPKTPIIDWTDPKCKVSKYFSVKEAIWLPQWARLANEADGLTGEIKDNLISLLIKMDNIRELLGKPVTVHCCFRPPIYNTLVKGAKNSAHLKGLAIDFSSDVTPEALGVDCNKIREILIPKLEELDIRLEDNGNLAPWVHIDLYKPFNNNRYFKP